MVTVVWVGGRVRGCWSCEVVVVGFAKFGGCAVITGVEIEVLRS